LIARAVTYTGRVVSRQLRIVVTLQVEFEHEGTLVRGTTADLSRTGVFVRTEHLVPQGEIVTITLTPPEGQPVTVQARVAHVLGGRGARVLGRHAGMGFEFVDQDGDARAALEALCARVIEGETAPDAALLRARILVADPSSRLCDRLADALTAAGFDPESVPSGADAMSRCQERAPRLVIVGDAMPIMDGWTLMARLATTPGLDELPVLMMSDDAGELNRLRAYRAGVADFLPRPFTSEELILRVRRLLAPGRRLSTEPRGATLRGSLGELTTGTLLSLLEFERKSGVLALQSSGRLARLFLADGRIRQVESTEPGRDALARLMLALDWTEGAFEFTPCAIEGVDQLGMSTQRLLLEHAKAHDEALLEGGRDPELDRMASEDG
jgi:DNA-binding response OmpR family regulator